ncbi:MAG: hypothetical protein WC356_02085 [Candidatus Micrarchaeia archaeon]|jgi:hypothetical protein
MASFLLWFQLAMMAVRLFQTLQDEKKTAEEKQAAVGTAVDTVDKVLPKAKVKESMGLVSEADMSTFSGVIGWLSGKVKENQ